MAVNLLIVESASKAKTIQKYLNTIPELEKSGKWEVMASLGHVMDLPSKQMGIDFNTWKMTYTPLEKKRDLIKKIKSAAAKANAVYLASDPDREGEAIAHHLKSLVEPHKKIVRVAFNEITKSAIKDAVLHPRDIDEQLVDAQETRRIMDRVVGYEASPLLWRRFATQALSAGRVQSAALCMCHDRALEIEAHVAKPYWTIEGTFEGTAGGAGQLVGVLHEKQAKVIMEDEKAARTLLRALAKSTSAKWSIEYTFKDSVRNPPPPLTTSAMQQEAYKKHGIPLKSTMRLAQALYEAGYITYMRTDSTTLSQEAQNMLLAYVREQFGEHTVHPRQYTSKVANAQEAHEAIRPTDANVRGKDLADLTPSHKKLYDLIWRRAVASQMKPARYAVVSFAISTKDVKVIKDQAFCGTTEILMEKGYLEVLNPELKATPDQLDAWKSCADASCHVQLAECAAHGDVERPPSHYTESTLVKALEKQGIGRPSTYATIIEKLFQKGYVYKGTNPQSTVRVTQLNATIGGDVDEEVRDIIVGGTESDRLVPSSLGQRVCEFLKEHVPLIVEIPFTADMEDQLDAIAAGRKRMHAVLKEFYKTFHTQVEQAQAVIKAKAKEAKGVKESSSSSGPKNVLKAFDGMDIKVVQTRFGPALYESTNNAFYSVVPYMNWKSKTIDELTAKDVEFITSLPRPVSGVDGVTLELGRYGLYLKKGVNNYRLPKDLWNAVATNKHCPEAIANIIAQQDATPKKKAARFTKAKPASSARARQTRQTRTKDDAQ